MWLLGSNSAPLPVVCVCVCVCDRVLSSLRDTAGEGAPRSAAPQPVRRGAREETGGPAEEGDGAQGSGRPQKASTAGGPEGQRSRRLGEGVILRFLGRLLEANAASDG